MAKDLVRNFGLSTLKAKELLAGTGDLLTGFGFTQEAALDLSGAVNKLAADLASFQNVPVEQASNAITKALLGEREALKGLGVAIIEADLIQMAKDMGQNFNAMTRVEKATLTYQAILKQTANAQGDFSRTSQSFSNQIKILRNRFEDWAVAVGTKLLPVFAPLVRLLNKVLEPEEDLLSVTKDLINAQSDYKDVLSKLAGEQGKLTKEEKINLEIRKQLLELDIQKKIFELNNAYSELIKSKVKINKLSNKENATLDSIKSKLSDGTDERIRLTNAEKELLGINEQVRFGTTQQISLFTDRDEILRKFNETQAKVNNTNTKSIKLQQAEKGLIDFIAQSLNDEKVSKEDLLGVNKRLVTAALGRQKALAKELADAEAKAKRDIEIAEAAERKEAEENERKVLATETKKESIKEIQELEQQAIELKLLNEQTLNSELKAMDQAALDAKKANLKTLVEAEKKAEKDRKKNKDFFRRQDVEGTRTALGDISSLTQSENKKLFKIGKVASLASATISAAEAILKTMTSVPFPFNIPLAALQGVAGAVQIDKISNTQFQGGLQEGTGFSGGGRFMVGERGPELLDVPFGASVTPNRELPGISENNTINNISNETINNDNTSNEVNISGVENLEDQLNELRQTQGINILQENG